MTAVILDFRTRRHVEMEVGVELFLRRELARRDEQLAAARNFGALMEATARKLAEEVAALRAGNATLRASLALAEPFSRWLRFWGIG